MSAVTTRDAPSSAKKQNKDVHSVYWVASVNSLQCRTNKSTKLWGPKKPHKQEWLFPAKPVWKWSAKTIRDTHTHSREVSEEMKEKATERWRRELWRKRSTARLDLLCSQRRPLVLMLGAVPPLFQVKTGVLDLDEASDQKANATLHREVTEMADTGVKVVIQSTWQVNELKQAIAELTLKQEGSLSTGSSQAPSDCTPKRLSTKHKPVPARPPCHRQAAY